MLNLPNSSKKFALLSMSKLIESFLTGFALADLAETAIRF
jgi:hypothetical protein